jgi:hypothetical protein
MLLNSHVSQVHVGVAYVLLFVAVPGVCKAGKSTSAAEQPDSGAKYLHAGNGDAHSVHMQKH